MKQNSLPNCVLGFALLLACVLGCTSGSNLSNTGNENKSTPRQTESPMTDIAGNYDVTGTNANGTPYKGSLEVIKHGSVYEFQWSAGKEYGGVGVQNGAIVAVAFANGSSGKGCGVVSYRLDGNTLDGKWGYWGLDESGSEIATRTSGTGLSGDYDLVGRNPTGTAYKGKLKITPEGGGYTFVWSNGSTGFGIKQGDTIAVGIGGARCGFMTYQIKSKSLEGIWGSSGSDKTGTERAVKK